MLSTKELSSQLPYLRRFSRALLGSQEAGDGQIEQMLIASQSEKAYWNGDGSPRVVLFRALVRHWAATDPSLSATRPGVSGPDRSLTALPPAPRLAFLLMSLEDFTIDEAASVLELSRGEIQDHIFTAHKQIAEQSSTDILVIEDELLIATQLESIVGDIGHRVIAFARTHDEARKALAKGTPGLILADIQLADGSSGLEAVNEILDKLSVPVIFITAYPERLLTGKKPEPAYLLNKPFTEDNVKAVVSQALLFHGSRNAVGNA